MLLLGLAFWFIYSRLGKLDLTFFNHPNNPVLYGALFLILWVVNLLLDALLWQRTQEMVEPINIKRALRINFISYALGFVTPINSGEVAGRYVMLNRTENRSKSVFLTFWSRFPRTVSRTVLGLISLLFITVRMEWLDPLAAIAIGSVLITAVLIIYFSLRKLQSWLSLKSIGGFQFDRFLLKGRPTAGEKLRLLSIAAMKFLTYNTQFVLLLFMWSPEPIPLEVVLAIPGFYLLSALIPGFAMLDFVFKSAVSIWLLDPLLSNEGLLIGANIVLWFFNVAVTALVGYYTIVTADISDKVKRKFSPDNRYDS